MPETHKSLRQRVPSQKAPNRSIQNNNTTRSRPPKSKPVASSYNAKQKKRKHISSESEVVLTENESDAHHEAEQSDGQPNAESMDKQVDLMSPEMVTDWASSPPVHELDETVNEVYGLNLQPSEADLGKYRMILKKYTAPPRQSCVWQRKKEQKTYLQFSPTQSLSPSKGQRVKQRH